MIRQHVIDELYSRKDVEKRLAVYKSGESALPTHAYCETTQPITLRKWDDHRRTDAGDPIMLAIDIPAGATLKIVMISRLGDFGLTDDLDAEHGYRVRLDVDSPLITNLRLEREQS